jgi:hypothetical protein
MTIGLVHIGQQLVERETHSAMPHAPVVPGHTRAPRPRLRRSRNATAHALHRAAARIEPAC